MKELIDDNRGDGALQQAARATAAEPVVSALRDGIANAGFILKSWDVTVTGYGTARIVAASRGKALAKAWRSDAFSGLSFKQFLTLASAWRAMFDDANFGAPITFEGKPAFFVASNRAYVQFAYPGSDTVFSAHPYDIEPDAFRPAQYRQAQGMAARSGETGTGSTEGNSPVSATDAPNPQDGGHNEGTH